MSRKQAVLLIHGIGEQRPMDTLRGFVNAVWTGHEEIHHPYAGGGLWSKPYNLSTNFELRRLTTPKNAADIQTDFFEFYWAHLMEGTSYGHVVAWARTLLVRRPSTVPRQLKSVYWLLYALLAAALLLFVYAAYGKVEGDPLVPPWLSTLAGAVLVPLAGFIVLKVLGDAARYLHVAPTNIQRRHEIRQAGLEVLQALHHPEREYDRIIVVGHSLGSVIGYDILTHAWVNFHRTRDEDKEAMDALEQVEGLALTEEPPIDAVQAAQRAYFEELRANGNPWRVTDFVTLGSPLAHAAILLAKDAEELERKQEDREFPTCLPVLETVTREGEEVRRFSFEAERRGGGYRVPHHAAVFAATRWTNLYFPCRAIAWGDLIGGPLEGVMGRSIRDVPVSTRQRGGLFSHTLYWTLPPKATHASHVKALREALDLVDQRSGNT